MKKILVFLLVFCCCYESMAQSKDVDKGVALQLVRANSAVIGLSTDHLNNVKISDAYNSTSGISMVYLQQTLKGIPVYNTMRVLAFKNGKLVSNEGSLINNIEKLTDATSSFAAVTPELAVQAALANRKLSYNGALMAMNTKDNGQKVEFGKLGISHENITAQMMWVPAKDGKSVRLAWQVYIVPTTSSDYWLVSVDANNSNILDIANYTVYCNWDDPNHRSMPGHSHDNKNIDNLSLDFKEIKNDGLLNHSSGSPDIVNNAAYRVVPFPAESPLHPGGTPALRANPWDLAGTGNNATTLKWHSNGTTDYNYTRGNNVWAYHDRTNNNTADPTKSATSTTNTDLTFDFAPDFAQAPTTTTPPNQQFNITNLFYWNNIIHDLTYQYGFDEVSGNFQVNNQSRGGLGNDAVNAEAQDGGGINNANFSTPPDGNSQGNPRMQMYLWNLTNPNRDGDVDNVVIVHEYAHGISNRLTGGPANSGCLQNAEQMGEGWSDYYALMTTQDWATATLGSGATPRGIGTYAMNQPITGAGVRSQPYSTNFNINNKVYLSQLPTSPHDRGEIWCATLWDMTWNIINQVGSINPNIFNANGTGGNSVALRLVTEGLRIQQCSPGFISGRNAILRADTILYGGIHSCAIWEAFRRRGMGVNASEGSTTSATDQVPDFTPVFSLSLTQAGLTQVPEGQNIVYTNTVNASCSPIANFILRDTLPSNVTYEGSTNGGSYDASTRVVSWVINQASGTIQTYQFTVKINAGSYFPSTTYIDEKVLTGTIPASWTATTIVPSGGTLWTVSNTQSYSAPNSFYGVDRSVTSDMRLSTSNSIALGARPALLSFWHMYNTEPGWDGGVVEISTNGGSVWSDLGTHMTQNSYNGSLGVGNPLEGRLAFTGLSAGFIQTKINLTAFANQNIQLRFRTASDDNTAPSGGGWFVDDILLKSTAEVNMRSSLFNASNVRTAVSDTITEILPPGITCEAPVFTLQPSNVSSCPTTEVSFSAAATALEVVTYQWQENTGSDFVDIRDGGIYNGAATATLTLTGITPDMNNYQYRVVASSCTPPVSTNSNAASLTIVSSSVGGNVSPANTSVCGTTNSGTLTVSGHTGSVVRWESATNVEGPWTEIPNSNADTYVYMDLTETTHFRAFVQVNGCTGEYSSTATVTFTAAPLSMTIDANPGTTLCTGDATILTVIDPNGTGGTIRHRLTQSTSAEIVHNNTFYCRFFNSNFALDTRYWRAYQLNYSSPFTIDTVTFAIDTAVASTLSNNPNPGRTPITVKIYTNTGGSFPVGTRTLVDSQTYLIPNQFHTLYRAVLPAPVIVPGNSEVVIQIHSPNFATTGHNFVFGSNPYGQSAPTYFSSERNLACPYTSPIDVATLPIPDPRTVSTHIILNVSGTTPGSGPVQGGTFSWSPAEGLSSTTANPVAAAPITTRTYTVNHDDGEGCVRQARITLTVNDRPAVTAQPENVAVCRSGIATFNVSATGTGLTYRWQQSADEGSSWTDLTDGTPYFGTTTASLTIDTVGFAMDRYQYRLQVSGTCDPVVYSDAAVLTVNDLPVVSVTPADGGCGGVAGVNGVELTASGADEYTWSPMEGLYTDAQATIPYTGRPTEIVYAAPGRNTVYTVIGTSGATRCSNTATVVVSHTPPAPVVVPASASVCLGGDAQALTIQSAVPVTKSVQSGTINLPITDGTGAATASTLSVSDIPAGAIVSEIRVRMNIPHTWVGDLDINLKAPNGEILNLVGGLDFGVGLNNTNNFTNTVVSSVSTTPMSGASAPRTGTFAADALPLFGPNDYTQTVTTWSALATQLNGDWTLAIGDFVEEDLGTLNSWEIEIIYTDGVPSLTNGIWTPNGSGSGLFTDPEGTIVYTGTPAATVYAKPDINTDYSVTVSTAEVPEGNTDIASVFTPNSARNAITFNFRNNNSYPVKITDIASVCQTAGLANVAAYYKASAINGAPGPIETQNGWMQFGNAAITSTGTITPQPFMSGLSLIVPPGATYGICVVSTGQNIVYSAVNPGTYIWSDGGCDIINGTNISYGGDAPPAAPTFTPRAFIGSLTFTGIGTSCTSTATLVPVTVNTPVFIYTQPRNTTVCTNNTATFTVEADGTSPVYQWQVSDDNGTTFTEIENGSVYSGANSPTLTLTAPPLSLDNNIYRVIVNGAAPCGSETSTHVRLRVNPLPTIVIAANPYTRLFPGLVTTLTSSVSPSAASTYTWYRDGVAVPGATASTHSVDADGLGSYRLGVTDINGCTNLSNTINISDSSTNKLFIYPTPNNGLFQVRYYSTPGNVLPRGLTIYDAKGARVFTKTYTIGNLYAQMDVDIRHLGKGVYWVELNDHNGNRITVGRTIVQ